MLSRRIPYGVRVFHVKHLQRVTCSTPMIIKGLRDSKVR